MAYKIFLIVILNVIFVNCENNELCACDTEPKDDAALWNFLKKLSAHAEDEENVYYVVPGQLSPMSDCDCESNRKKRKAVEEPEVPAEVEDESEDESEGVRQRKSIRFGDKRCPQGFVRLSFTCVDQDYLE